MVNSTKKFGKKVTCEYAATEKEYGCKIKAHDELAKLPNYIEQAMEKLEGVIESFEVENSKSGKKGKKH